MADQREGEATPEFVLPQRKILNVPDLQKWLKSQLATSCTFYISMHMTIPGYYEAFSFSYTEAHRDFLGFISTLNAAVKGKRVTSDCHLSETSTKLINLLNSLHSWIDEIPPIDQPQRFGNKAYRSWSSRLVEKAEELILPLLPAKFRGASIELKAYLCGGFGNSTRIDYGTGHEASFVAFLCCLYKLRILTPEDETAIVFKVFHRYLEVTRKLQTTYNMEPAGSQGVWGLDDFQFLPFFWGSSQLISHPDISPSKIVVPECVEMYRSDYIFFEAVAFILQVKTGPFAEHSNVLWGISGVPEWTKVNSGLLKMYKAEVLGKFPVIQHFEFGTLLSIQSV